MKSLKEHQIQKRESNTTFRKLGSFTQQSQNMDIQNFQKLKSFAEIKVGALEE